MRIRYTALLLVSISFLNLPAMMELDQSTNEPPSLKDFCIEAIAKLSNNPKQWQSQLPEELIDDVTNYLDLQQRIPDIVAPFFVKRTFRLPIKTIKYSSTLDTYRVPHAVAITQDKSVMAYVAKDKKIVLRKNNEEFKLPFAATDVVFTENPFLIWTFNDFNGGVHCYDCYGNNLHFFNSPAYYDNGDLRLSNNTIKIVRRLKNNDQEEKEWDPARFRRFVEYAHQLPIKDMRALQSRMNNHGALKKYMHHLFALWAKRFENEQKIETQVAHSLIGFHKPQVIRPKKKQRTK